MWLTLLSIIYGVLISLDPILFVFIGYSLNATGFYLGLLSAVWSIAYIVASKLLNRVADEGYNKLLALLTLACLAASYICFRSLNYVTAILSYTMHAVSIASINLAVSVTILECTDSDLWYSSSVLQRSLSSFSRGFTLLFISFRGIASIHNLFWLSFLLTTVSLPLLPSISLSFERRFYRLSRNLNELGMYIKASSSILFLDKPAVARHVFNTSWEKGSSISLYRVLLSIAIATALGDYIFAVLPLILREHMALNTVWIAYGVASLFSAAIVVIFKDFSVSRRSFTIFVMVLRICILVLGLSIVRDLASLTTYIILSSLLYLLVDVTLYNMFIEASAGFSTANYFTFREIGSIIGSLIGGMAIGFGRDVFLGLAAVIGSSAILILI